QDTGGYRGKRPVFGDIGQRIEAKTVDTFFEPEPEDIIKPGTYFRKIPVEIGLLRGEVMQVPGSGRRIVGPGAAERIEETATGGRLAVSDRPPDIVTVVGIVTRAAGLLEPLMPVAGMI